ncbi:MAG: FAD-dependent oxidoreductase [Zetaproteobacteria bacterium]|nr:FAD-dependent oxidoreductase [Zetaproteobacteria bacterium]
MEKTTVHLPTAQNKVIILGAGVAGLHMAAQLRQRGIKDIVLLEKSDRAGGKVETIHSQGVAYDMGPVLITSAYRHVKEALRQYCPENREIPRNMGRKTRYAITNLTSDPSTLEGGDYVDWMTAEMHKAMGGTHSSLSKTTWCVLKAAWQYLKIHRRIFPNHRDGLPPRPNTTDLTLLAQQNTLQFLQQHNLEVLTPLFDEAQTGQGYGSLSDVPALYALWWTTPTLIWAFVKSHLPWGTPLETILEHGYQPLFEGMIQQEKLEISLNVDITHIDRNHSGAHPIHVEGIQNGTKVSYNGDFLICACPAEDLLPLIKEPSQREQEIFPQLQTLVATSTLFRAQVPQHYWTNTVLLHNPIGNHRLLVFRTPKADLNNNRREDNDLFVAYQYGEQDTTLEEINHTMLQNLHEIGVKEIRIEHCRKHRYFPHFGRQAIERGYPWEIFAMQGHNRTWWIGSSACFESVNEVFAYNKQVLDTYFVATERKSI